MDSLIGCNLVQAADRDPGGRVWLWRVHFKTKSWFPREALNLRVLERYGKQ
jgi:hypothetical protein